MSALPPYASPLEKAWFWTFRIGCGLILFFLIAPIIAVVPLSFNSQPYFTYPMEGFSWRWYYDFFDMCSTQDIVADYQMRFDAGEISDNPCPQTTSGVWLSTVKNSIIVAIFSTLLATTLGTIAAMGLSKGRFFGKGFVQAVLISPMIVPLVITAVGLFFFYSAADPGLRGFMEATGINWLTTTLFGAELGLTGSLMGLVLAHATLGIPFVVITVTATMVSFNQNLVRAALSLGSSPVRSFFKVTFPLIIPGIFSGGLFAFITSFDEVILVLFLAGPEERTLPRQMFSGIREQLSPTIAAAAGLLVVLAIILMIVMELLRRRGERLRGIQS
ncbi:ABC transporter permease [Curvivirga sp.]|uniref:ABC transporter permease n=1 Tax=Curvivirga sp. TaxID=2856848 RepID=UPI003B597AF7